MCISSTFKAYVLISDNEMVPTDFFYVWCFFLILGHISLEGLFSTLWENNIRSVMVEGGASVISSFLKSGLVDSFLLTIAPVYVGKDGVSAVEDAEVKNIFQETSI